MRGIRKCDPAWVSGQVNGIEKANVSERTRTQLTIFLGSVPVGNNLKDLLATGGQVSNPVVMLDRQEGMRHS